MKLVYKLFANSTKNVFSENKFIDNKNTFFELKQNEGLEW